MEPAEAFVSTKVQRWGKVQCMKLLPAKDSSSSSPYYTPTESHEKKATSSGEFVLSMLLFMQIWESKTEKQIKTWVQAQIR